MYKSVSAFAPIANPTQCPWGIKAFTGYLGPLSLDNWNEYDASELLKKYSGPHLDILVDTGTADSFLKEQLKLDALQDAVAHVSNVSLESRMQEGYDHSYWFISTFVDDHLAFHFKHLNESS